MNPAQNPVDNYYQFVKIKNIHSTEPKTWPWGKREFVVKDPDGYKLVFYSVSVVIKND